MRPQTRDLAQPAPRVGVRVADWLVPAFAILSQYTVPHGSVGVYVMLLYLLWTMIAGGAVRIHKPMLVLVALVVIEQLFVAFAMSFGYSDAAAFTNVASIAAMTLVVSSVAGKTTSEGMYRAYSVVGIVVTCVAIGQFLATVLLGQRVGAIPLAPLPEDASGYWALDSGRPSAFFTEAQTYSSAMLPLVAWSLARRNRRLASFVTVGILSTSSSLGILLAAALWVFFLARDRSSRWRAIIAGIAALTLMPVLLSSGLGLVDFSFEKIASIFRNYSQYTTISDPGFADSTSYSNYLRLIKGPATFFELPPMEQLVGIGRYNTAGYISATGRSFSWSPIWPPSEPLVNYMSAGFGILVEFGVVVGLVYCWVLIRLFRRGTEIQRVLLVLLLAQSLVSQFFFNGLHVFYLLLIFASGPLDASEYVTVLSESTRGLRRVRPAASGIPAPGGALRLHGPTSPKSSGGARHILASGPGVRGSR